MTSRSRSPTVSRPRRRLPAGVIASTPGVCRSVGDQFGGHAFGVAQQVAAGAQAVLRDGAQHLLFQLGAHARQHAQLLLLAEAFQLVDGADAVVLEDERDALRPEPLDFEELERAGRELLRAARRAARRSRCSTISRQHRRQALADAGNIGDLARRIAQDIGDALGMAFDGRGAVAVAADAEGILAGDLHQIGRLPQHARDFLVLHPMTILAIVGRARAYAGSRASLVPAGFARPRRASLVPAGFARPRRASLVPAGFARPRRLRRPRQASLVPAGFARPRRASLFLDRPGGLSYRPASASFLRAPPRMSVSA